MRLIPVSPDYRDGLARFQECQKRPRSRIRRTGLQQHGLLIDGRMQRLGNDPARAALHSDELACGHKSQIGSTCRDKLIGLGNRAAPHDPGRERRIDTKLLQCLDRSHTIGSRRRISDRNLVKPATFQDSAFGINQPRCDRIEDDPPPQAASAMMRGSASQRNLLGQGRGIDISKSERT